MYMYKNHHWSPCTHPSHGDTVTLWVQAPTVTKTVILSWLQNDGTRGFSKDQLRGKQLSLMFWPDALVVFRALKMTRASGQNVGESCFPLSWSIENPSPTVTSLRIKKKYYMLLSCVNIPQYTTGTNTCSQDYLLFENKMLYHVSTSGGFVTSSRKNLFNSNIPILIQAPSSGNGITI